MFSQTAFVPPRPARPSDFTITTSEPDSRLQDIEHKAEILARKLSLLAELTDIMCQRLLLSGADLGEVH